MGSIRSKDSRSHRERQEDTNCRQRFYANPPDVVLKVLRDGRVPEEVIKMRVRLIKGWFHETVPVYQGQIALLHLDGDLYESYRVPLQHLYSKVARGGVIMFEMNI